MSCVNDINSAKYRIRARPTIEFINVLVKYEDFLSEWRPEEVYISQSMFPETYELIMFKHIS